MSDSTILKVHNLNVTLQEQPIIHRLSFNLEAGKILAVIGPNGSGKTVLLKSLLGLLPSTGEITWAGNTRVGYVPQKIEADRHLPLTVENLLHAKAGIQRISKQEVKRIIKRLNLSPAILSHPVGHLSGGQFQKALIAFALVGKPNVILFDEPTASLDQLTEEHVYELIHELQQEENISVILVSHELSVVYRYADEVLCLNKENLCFGPPETALTPEVLEKLYGPAHKLHSHHE